jgi:uncharacterized protein (TIGR00369 family)
MISEQLKALKEQDVFDIDVSQSPYSALLGLRVRRNEAGEITTVMKYSDDLIGAPFPPALHGGTLIALLEMASFFELACELDMELLPKTVNVNVDFLRGGKPQDCFASARVFRKGRRFANLHAKIWQDDPDKPIATARLHFLIVDPAQRLSKEL